MIVYPSFISNWFDRARFRAGHVPLQRPPLSVLAQNGAALPRFGAECRVAEKYLSLLGPLDWANFPDRASGRAWPGPKPLSPAPFVAAYLVKLHEGKTLTVV